MDTRDRIVRLACALGITAPLVVRPYKGSGDDSYLLGVMIAEIGTIKRSGDIDQGEAGALTAMEEALRRMATTTREMRLEEIAMTERSVATLRASVDAITEALGE